MANFTPTLGDYTELKPFRFWCQKVLPLVYDDSLSYYELLCKVVDYLNKTMEDVDTLHTDVENLHTAYEQLQEFVNDYFDNLDVQQEINDKLDAMAQDGSLSELLSPFIPDLVSDWLDEHITPTTPAIDNTLTVSGAGADSKTVGDIIKMPYRMNGFIAGASPITYNAETNRIESTAPIYAVIPLMHVIDNISTQDGNTYYVEANPYAGYIMYNPSTHALTSSANINTAYSYPDYCVISDPRNIETSYEYNLRYKLSTIKNYNEPMLYGEAPIEKINSTTVKCAKAMVLIIPQLNIIKVFGNGTTGYTVTNPNGGDYLYYDSSVDDLILSDIISPTTENQILLGVFNRYFLNSDNAVLSQTAKATLFASNPIYHDVITNRLLCVSNFTVLIPQKGNAYTVSIDGTDEKGFKYINLGNNQFIYFNTETNKITSLSYQTTSSSSLIYLFSIYPYVYDNLEITSRPNIKNVYGKKAICYGDSVTWYDGQEYSWGRYEGQIAIGYEHYMRGLLHLDVVNRGLSGDTIPQICTRIRNSSDLTSTDYLLITGGANDERHGTELGTLLPIQSTFDTTTFYGALQSAIEYALRQKSMLKIILMTPIQGFIKPNGYTDGATGDGYIDEKWADAIIRVAKLYSLPVCDWYYHSGLNYFNRNSYYADPTFESGNDLYILHPSPHGFERMASMLLPVVENC